MFRTLNCCSTVPFPRYIFLFDKVVIVCKRKGYCYELKEIIELQSYKMSDDPMNNRDMKKVGSSVEHFKTRDAQFPSAAC